jgi:hypothetical protein
MTRCKVGDICVIAAGSTEDGKMVSVLRAATPDDVAEWEPEAWFVESMGSPIVTYTMNGSRVLMRRRAIRDRELRPIRPGEAGAVDSRDVLLGQRAAA